jgi:hypothetical protein
LVISKPALAQDSEEVPAFCFNYDYRLMKTLDKNIDQVALSIIANVIRDKFSGHADFEPLAQFDDLFIFKSRKTKPLFFNLWSNQNHGHTAEINERQFELVKPSLKKEIADVTGLQVTHLNFIAGKGDTRFLIVALAATNETNRTSMNKIMLAN